MIWDRMMDDMICDGRWYDLWLMWYDGWWSWCDMMVDDMMWYDLWWYDGWWSWCDMIYGWCDRMMEDDMMWYDGWCDMMVDVIECEYHLPFSWCDRMMMVDDMMEDDMR